MWQGFGSGLQGLLRETTKPPHGSGDGVAWAIEPDAVGCELAIPPAPAAALAPAAGLGSAALPASGVAVAGPFGLAEVAGGAALTRGGPLPGPPEAAGPLIGALGDAVACAGTMAAPSGRGDGQPISNAGN